MLPFQLPISETVIFIIPYVLSDVKRRPLSRHVCCRVVILGGAESRDLPGAQKTLWLRSGRQMPAAKGLGNSRVF